MGRSTPLYAYARYRQTLVRLPTLVAHVYVHFDYQTLFLAAAEAPRGRAGQHQAEEQEGEGAVCCRAEKDELGQVVVALRAHVEWAVVWVGPRDFMMLLDY